MKSEKIKTEDLRALEWYAAMEIEIGICHPSENNRHPREVHTYPRESQYHPREGGDKVKTNRPLSDNIDNNPINLDPSLSMNDKLERAEHKNLDSLKSAVMNFEGCILKQTATNTVFGDGIPTSKIMIIGEAPGATEDAQGIPFCGESGKLLDNMIASIGLSRKKNVYITNTIFWRPPGNRAPTDEEIEACRPFVEQHIALINPKLLILVGSTAVTSLLGKHLQISKIRQEHYQYTNKYLDKHITTTALFHPAYLLRQPMQKKTTWHDLLKIKEFIERQDLPI